jgi:hypothetical protein
MALHRNDVPAQIETIKESGDEAFDASLDHQVQTDKEMVKLVPCRECKRPLVVTTFFAPAKAICSVCKGDPAATQMVAVVVPGQSDPTRVSNLESVLVNKHFANALCPVHPDDPEHVMELKTVFHNPEYGPGVLIGYKDGRPNYRMTDVGETVMHQCLHCKACVTYSTTAQVQFRRANEPRTGKSMRNWELTLGAREVA